MQLLASLLALTLCAHGAAVSKTGGAARSPLLRLGTLIDRSLPELKSGALAAQKAPASLDASKALVLLERARLADAGSLSVAPADESAPSPQSVLAAVNAVLKDVSPEQLRSMPLEQLYAVTSVIMDAAQGKDAASPEAISALSNAKLENLKKLQAVPLKESLLVKGQRSDDPDHVIVRGVPKGVKVVPRPAHAVYRYYVTKEGLEGILKSGGIWNGLRPLMTNFGEGFQKYYPDLTGVFLTSPQTPGHVAGLPASQFPAFVDVKIPGDIPLLDVLPEFPGTFFLLPLPARTQGWIRDSYLSWLRGEEVAPYYLDTIRSLDAEGGPGPDLTVPLEIVGHGLIGADGRSTYIPAVKTGAVLPAAEALVAGLSRARVLEAESSDALLAALRKNPFLREQYDQAVVAERYTLHRHTRMVLEQFKKYGNLPLPRGIPPKLFRLLLALHDSGKPAALAAGDPSLQHARTGEILAAVLPHLGFDVAALAKAKALAGGDPIGAYLQGALDVEAAARAVRALAAQAGMSEADFFTALLTLFKADAGAYTEDAGGQASLDDLFEFDRAARTIRLSPANELKVQALAARLKG